jgi:hypothetical protein
MKKTVISASIAAMIGGVAFVGAANAAVLAPVADASTSLTTPNTGVGHILFVPYFTSQGSNATLLNIVNTDTTNGKIVKVRFRGASNSDDLFDFTLLMSPGDVWAAKISKDANGISQLETADKSCTLPSIVATQTNSFGTSRLNSSLSAEAKAAETREGYIEILTMADVPKFASAAQAKAAVSGVTAGTSINSLYTAIKHVSGVAPCTTTELAKLALDPISYADVTDATTASKSATGLGMDYPTGGLMANSLIIDVVKTASFSSNAVALAASGSTTNKANLVFFPQNGTTMSATTLTTDALGGVNAAATIDSVTADPLLRTNSLRVAAGATTWTAGTTSLITPTNVDLPDMSTPYYATGAATGVPVTALVQAGGLTAALAAKSVINEYLTTTSIGATTDWVFSMPTRRYNVALNYAYNNPLGGDGRVFTDYGANANYFTTVNTSVSSGKICVGADSVTQWDREETTTTSGFVISPATVTTVQFCGETSVLGINNGTAATSGSLSASVATQNINVASNEGWLKITHNGLSNAGGAFPSAAGTAANGLGLPVIGSAYTKSAAFGAVWGHRYAR